MYPQENLARTTGTKWMAFLASDSDPASSKQEEEEEERSKVHEEGGLRAA